VHTAVGAICTALVTHMIFLFNGRRVRWDGVMWTGLIWLRIGTGGELL
jgi:hypothetical protein